MTGYELLKKIKESSIFRDIPAVVMSSENILTRIDRCLEEGAEEFLLKPVKLADVKQLKEFIMKGEVKESGGERKESHKRKRSSGNPIVTPEVIRDVCLLAKMMAANLYFSQIEDLMFEVDDIFIESIKDAGLYDTISQAFAVFLPVKSIEVQGVQRTYSDFVVLRAVTSEDGMTVEGYCFERKFEHDVSVNRVIFNPMSKPPSTIEWE